MYTGIVPIIIIMFSIYFIYYAKISLTIFFYFLLILLLLILGKMVFLDHYLENIYYSTCKNFNYFNAWPLMG